MAKAPWARLTKPISPIVTDSPTETMNSTVPAASPPNSMLTTSIAEITGNPHTARGRRIGMSAPVDRYSEQSVR